MSARAGRPLDAVGGRSAWVSSQHRRTGPIERARAGPRTACPTTTCCTWGASIATRDATRCSSTSSEYARERDDVTLVLAGPAKMQIPRTPRIRALGYVSGRRAATRCCRTRARSSCLRRTRASASCCWKAWNHAHSGAGQRPLLGARGPGARADGGLSYRSAREFHEALAYLLYRPGRARRARPPGAAPTSSASTAGQPFSPPSNSCCKRCDTARASRPPAVGRLWAKAPTPRRARRLGRTSLDLDHHRDAHPAADAQRGHPVTAAAGAQGVDERGQHARAAGPDRVAERDRAAREV